MRNYIPALHKVNNPNGPTLCYAEGSGVSLLEKDGLFFKDLAKDGELHPYEDWRLPAEERAKDLAARMTIEQIAGLMLYSSHQAVPGSSRGPFGKTTYGGKVLEESGAPAYAMSDQQEEFLRDNFVRHVLVTSVDSSAHGAMWNNNLQACAEALPLGIPVNISSDPRHGTSVTFEFNAGAGGDISHWPEPLGLAASFSPDLVKKFGEIASKEYRALGISTALSPQVDMATEPRWSRFDGTFGEGPQLSADIARAYCDGFQTSTGEKEIAGGWGYESVNAMVKHWPGGGSGEAGRDAHFGSGKYAVYPGNNFKEHLTPFVEGAFKLEGETKKAAAVMPYYTISYGQDTVNGENVGNSYSKYIITDLLRNEYNYDEVVCTDWMITPDQGPLGLFFGGKCWGVEHLTQGERCYKIIEAGVDQFGGLNTKAPVLEAYELGVKEHGEAYMRARFEKSAVRLLKNIFRTGLFENPYLNAEETAALVGCPEFMEAGFDAQRKSVVMLKNKANVLPLPQKAKLYIPKTHMPAITNWRGETTTEGWVDAVNMELVRHYFDVTEDPAEADAAVCFIHSPDTLISTMRCGYSEDDRNNGGNGYVPISLQYRPYTAKKAREVSLAGGDPLDASNNRTYKDKTVTVCNETELDAVLETRKQMGDKPVIVCVQTGGPLVVNEFEPAADAVLVQFGTLTQAVMEILSGQTEPSALLPMQLPANMDTVEEQYEDVPYDMECHVDTEGNTYDFAYGMNWSGVIDDERTAKYRAPSRKK